MNITRRIMKKDIMNKNGRIYDSESIQQIINDYNNWKDRVGILYDQFGHPDTFDTSLVYTSHTIDNLYMEDDYLVADIKILNTYWGKKLKEEIDNYTFSMRSTGTVNSDGKVTIVKFYSLDAILISESSYDIDFNAELEDDSQFEDSFFDE